LTENSSFHLNWYASVLVKWFTVTNLCGCQQKTSRPA
jgi:hypothetical protein